MLHELNKQNVRMQIEQHAQQVEVLRDLLKDEAGSLERMDGWRQEIQWRGERMLELEQSLQLKQGDDREAYNRVVQRHSLL